MYLDWDLGLSVSVDMETFKRILGELKNEGWIDHFSENTDTWVPINPDSPRLYQQSVSIKPERIYKITDT